MDTLTLSVAQLSLGSLPGLEDRFASTLNSISDAFTDVDVIRGQEKIQAKVTIEVEIDCATETGMVSVTARCKVKLPGPKAIRRPVTFRGGRFMLQEDDSDAQLELVPFRVHPNLERVQ